MKLLIKITLINLLLALAAFGVGGVMVYYDFKREVKRETDFSLIETYMQWEHAIQSGLSAPDIETDLVSFVPITETVPRDTQFVFSDTTAMHPVLKRPEWLRKLRGVRHINGQAYQVTLMNVFIEKSDISRIVKKVLRNLFIVLGIIIIVFNFLISRWLLRPFDTTLQKIKTFSLQSGKAPGFSKSTTVEFQQLNDFLTEMLKKVGQDYRTLKEFSENASHEMQTPIAAASGKLELLLEAPGLSEEQIQLVQDAQQALSRLSRLGGALLLLTKIENQEFAPQTPVDFSSITTAEVNTFEELAKMKGLDFQRQITPNIQVHIDSALAHILVSNLLKNAVRHNQEDGWIKVELDGQKLSVSNPGAPPQVPTDQLFERFQKSNQSNKSLGLGLAIVKKICEVNHFQVSYSFEAGIHTVQVIFNTF